MRWIAPRLLGRWALWLSLLVLLVCMVGTLVWLAGRYEISQVENRMAEDASDAVSDIRNGLTRNVQSLQALQFAGQSAVHGSKRRLACCANTESGYVWSGAMFSCN